MSSSGISHIDQAETRNDTAFTRNATRYPKLADATPPSAAPTVISRKRDENINALPAKRPSSPVMFGIEAFFAASKNAPANGAKTEKGTRRQTTIMAVASGAADVTVRIRPSAAMKLNQLPSSETTWPPHSHLNDLLFTINCL